MGLTRTERVLLFTKEDPLVLESGERLAPVEVAYETYGALNASRSNAVFVCHALTGDAHAAGHHGDPSRVGWWDNLIGPGKPLDTDRYHVLCANLLGGCQGTTGPSSPDPATGDPYGLRFPAFTVADLVAVHRALLARLGIRRLAAAIGGSLGGMQVLQWALDHPDDLEAAILVCASARLSAQNIAFSAVARASIMRDEHFAGGDYYGNGGRPDVGLAVARMLAHITYLSELSLDEKFGRRHRNGARGFEADFEIEHYLDHQGESFRHRFDANSYLYLSRVMDYFDPFADEEAVREKLRRSSTRFLLVSFDSDWRFDSGHSRQIADTLAAAGADVVHHEIASPHGHDSFLLPIPAYHRTVREFLGSRNGQRPSLRLASAVERLGTESAFAVLARARELERQGREVIHLEIGEPGFDTAEHVGEAAWAAIRAGHTRYCPAPGIPELREAAAAHLAFTRGIDVDPARVLVATGAKPLLFFGVLATCEPGDEVVYPDPGFPIYESAIRFAGATPVPLPLREEAGFSFSVEELDAALTPRTRLVILNSPHNPTGSVIPPADLATAAELISATGAWVLSDEVYAQIVYEGEARSVAAEPGAAERTILVDSLSKTFAMSGWRCGYAAVPDALVEPLTRFLVNSTSCVPPFVQHAAVAALTGPMDQPRAMVEEFRARRDLVVAGLNGLPGVSCRTPAGAFYAFPNVSGVPVAADELATLLLEEAGVAVLSGGAFGSHGRDHLRLSYASSSESLSRALERMRRLLSSL